MSRLDQISKRLENFQQWDMEAGGFFVSDVAALVAVARHAAEMYAHEDRYNEQGIGDDEINKAIHAYDLADQALRAALAPLLESTAPRQPPADVFDAMNLPAVNFPTTGAK